MVLRMGRKGVMSIRSYCRSKAMRTWSNEDWCLSSRSEGAVSRRLWIALDIVAI